MRNDLARSARASSRIYFVNSLPREAFRVSRCRADRIDRPIRSVESIVRQFSCRLRGKAGTRQSKVSAARLFFLSLSRSFSLPSLNRFPIGLAVSRKLPIVVRTAASAGNGSEDRRNFTAVRFTSIPLDVAHYCFITALLTMETSRLVSPRKKPSRSGDQAV